jgi:hypothetical protein
MSSDQQQSGDDTGQFIGCVMLLIVGTLFLAPAIVVLFFCNGFDLEEAWTTAVRQPLAFIGSFFFWMCVLWWWASAKDKLR